MGVGILLVKGDFGEGFFVIKKGCQKKGICNSTVMLFNIKEDSTFIPKKFRPNGQPFGEKTYKKIFINSTQLSKLNRTVKGLRPIGLNET